VPGCAGKTNPAVGSVGANDFCYLPESAMKMTISALTVNKDVVDAANWTTTKSFTARMLSSTTAIPATSSINIIVVPCEITEATIATITTQIGNSI